MDTIALVTALLLEITLYIIVTAIIMLQLIAVIWILTTIIKKVFTMQLPTTLANAIVPFPSATLRKEIATSGAQVPNATIVNAINILGILQRIAKEDAQSTKISLDLIIIINPKSKKTTSNMPSPTF